MQVAVTIERAALDRRKRPNAGMKALAVARIATSRITENIVLILLARDQTGIPVWYYVNARIDGRTSEYNEKHLHRATVPIQ